MNLENVRFQEHCEMWHQYNGGDRLADDSYSFPPIFNVPSQQQQNARHPQYQPVQNWYHRDSRHWQQGNRHKHGSFSNLSASGSYRVQHSLSVGGQNEETGNGRSNRTYNRSASSCSGTFPPRRTLIDTFVDRNDEYWKNRVTIKMDVSFTDHSHVIGKQGRNTQAVMKETGCHIHFPDANRNPDMEKSNMVTIAGPMQSVDQARIAIRDLAPLVITLELKNYMEDATMLADDPVFKEITMTPGLNVLMRTNRSSGTPFFVVRGSIHQTNIIRDVVIRLQQRFMHTTKAICSTSMEVLKDQQPVVVGLGGTTIQLISQKTGATIYYPRGDGGSATTFFIQGAIDSILDARRHLIGCLPLSFAFDLPKESLEPLAIEDLQMEYGVAINTRPGRCGEPSMVIVKGQERQTGAMYGIRQRLLGCNDPSVMVDEYDFMKDIPIPSLDVFMGEGTVPSASPFVPPNSIASTAFTFPAPFASLLPYSPLTPTPLSFFSSLGDPRYFGCQWGAGDGLKDGTVAGTSHSSGAVASTSQAGASSSIRSSPIKQDTISGPGMESRIDPHPNAAPLASGILLGAQKIQASDSSWKAPGAGRHSSVDYEAQQLLATKAMREKPNGPRFPTDHWSGMGFSRSMPSTVVAKLGDRKESKLVQVSDLDVVDEESDQIGPWPLEPATKQRKSFNSTTYFDCGMDSVGKLDLENIDDMASLMSQLHLVKYADVFREQEIDIATFLTMTEEDLKELGVNTFGARRKLLMAIRKLKEMRRPSHRQ